MQRYSKFLISATIEQLNDILSAIGTSAAVFEKRTDSYTIVSANQQFVLMGGKEQEPVLEFPKPLVELLPRYSIEQFNECLLKVFSQGESNDAEFPFDQAAETYWWRCSFAPILDERQQVVRVFCTGINITEKHMLRVALDNSRSKLEAVVENAYDGIVVCDRGGVIKSVNTAALNIFAYTREELIDQPLNILLPKQIRAKHADYLDAFAQSPIRARIMQERAQVHGVRKGGGEFPAEISISKTNSSFGLEFTAIIRDETEKLHLIEQLRHEATTDYLTGLLNRRSFLGRLSEELTRAKRYSRPLSLAMLDLDDFKKINDTYGHDVGDETLKQVSDIMMMTCRQHDVCARVGGEEFCILMSETPVESAELLLERIRRSVEEYGEKLSRNVSVSIGIATDFEDGDDGPLLLKKADEKLYQAKEKGKNCIVS